MGGIKSVKIRGIPEIKTTKVHSWRSVSLVRNTSSSPSASTYAKNKYRYGQVKTRTDHPVFSHPTQLDKSYQNPGTQAPTPQLTGLKEFFVSVGRGLKAAFHHWWHRPAAFGLLMVLPPHGKDTVEAIGKIFDEGHVEEAKDRIRAFLKDNPQSAGAKILLGTIFVAEAEMLQKEGGIHPTIISSRLRGAEREFREALELDPNNIHAQNNLAAIYYELGDAEKAITELKKALALDQNYIPAWNNLGEIYFDMGQFENAKIQFQKILELNPDDFSAKFWMVKIYHVLGKINKAEKKLRALLKKYPDDAKVHTYLAKLHQDQGRLDEVQKELIKVTQIDPNNVSAYINLGNLALNARNFYEAEIYFKKAIEIEPKEYWHHYNLGLSYFQSGQREKARLPFERAVKIDDQKADPHLFLGLIYHEAGKTQKSKKAFNKALSLAPNNFSANLHLGEWHLESGEFPKAEEYFKKAGELNPTRPGPHLHLARIYFSTNRLTMGFEALKTSLEKEHLFPPTHQYLMELFGGSGIFSQLKSTLDKLISVTPLDPLVYYFLGFLYSQNDHISPAQGYYEMATSLKNDFSLAHFRLANVYLIQGEISKGVRSFQQAEGIAEAHLALAAFYYHQGSTAEASRHASLAQEVDSGLDVEEMNSIMNKYLGMFSSLEKVVD